jgi:hypothetical protein
MLDTLIAAKDARKLALRPRAIAPAGDLPAETDRPAPVATGPKEVLDRTIEKIARERGGLPFSEMKDDLPF